MLDRGPHPFALQAADIGHGEAGGQVGVFGKTFKIAPTQRGALNVDRWA